MKQGVPALLFGNPVIIANPHHCVITYPLHRAPTIQSGLTPFCKDSFYGSARLRVWRRSPAAAGRVGGVPSTQPFLDATTNSAAVEVGACVDGWVGGWVGG
jgi:hypothetical protein